MIRKPLLLALLLSTAALATPATRPSNVTITPDRPLPIYHRGQTVTFTITANVPVSQPLTYKLTKDGFGPPLRSGDLPALPTTLTASLDEPGVLRLEIRTAADHTLAAVAGAAIDPDQLKPSLPPPDDFDAFWDAQKKLVEDDKSTPTLTPVDSPAKDVVTFDVQQPTPGGAPLSAYYALPKSAKGKPKSLPAILFPHSAGVRSSQLTQAVHGAQLGCLALDFNAHGIPNGKPAEYYTDLLNGDLKGYSAKGRESRDTIYFRGMLLRLIRAIEFVTTQPEWDGKTLIVYGSSQGGGQALVAAGLDPRITLCCASVPALCDHTAFRAHRIPGWPKLVPHDADWNYTDPAIIETSRYYDAVNFARKIHAQTLVTTGLIDATCPPSSVYTAFNAIPTPNKTILPQPAMSHDFPPRLRKAFDEAVQAHIAAQMQTE